MINANMLLVVQPESFTAFKFLPLGVETSCGLKNMVHYVLYGIDLGIVITKGVRVIIFIVIIDETLVKCVNFYSINENCYVRFRQIILRVDKLCVGQSLFL